MAANLATELHALQGALDVERVADRVGLHLDRGLAFEVLNGVPTTEGPDGIRQIVSDAVNQIRASGPQEREQLVKLRVFFESIMGLDIAADPAKRLSAVQRLRAVQVELYRLCEANLEGQEAFEIFWETDGEFHRQLCLCSGRSHLAVAVDTVVRLCKDFGRPRRREDLNQTLEEHEAIIDAIGSEHGEDSAIEAVVGPIEVHVEKACERWFAKERNPMSERDNSDSHDPDGIVESEQAFKRDLAELARDHYGKWVAYNRSRRLFIGRSQTEVYRKCLELRLKRKLRLKKSEFVVRSIGIVNADAEL